MFLSLRLFVALSVFFLVLSGQRVVAQTTPAQAEAKMSRAENRGQAVFIWIGQIDNARSEGTRYYQQMMESYDLLKPSIAYVDQLIIEAALANMKAELDIATKRRNAAMDRFLLGSKKEDEAVQALLGKMYSKSAVLSSVAFGIYESVPTIGNDAVWSLQRAELSYKLAKGYIFSQNN